MNVGSLFSGIGGFDLGLERAGMRVLWQCEIDGYCQRVLARHWPDVLRVPDVREVRAGSVPPVDVLCGGFPCQDISLAGKGAGIDGSRSGLWREFARLIGELRPRYVIVENVPALTSRGLDRVLADLAACGFDAEWDHLPASAFGAPHRRDRLWLVAYTQRDAVRQQPAGLAGGESAALAGIDGASRAMADADGSGCLSGITDIQARQSHIEGCGAVADAECEGQLQPSGCECESGRWPSYCRDAMANTDRKRLRADPQRRHEAPRLAPGGDVQDADECALRAWRVGGRATQAGGAEWWSVEPPMGRVAHGVPGRLDQLAALGNALVPQIAQWIGERIMSWEHTQKERETPSP